MVKSFRTPILLNVFNRPEETERVLSILRDLEPEELYVHCDGPRHDNQKDRENVERHGTYRFHKKAQQRRSPFAGDG